MESALPDSSVHRSKENLNENTSTKKVLICSSFQDYAERTTCHGVYYVVHGGLKLRRLIWLLTILGFSGYFFFTTVKLFSQYRKRPVTTKNSVVDPGSILFPVVTICNFNKIRKSYLDVLQLAVRKVSEEDRIEGNVSLDVSSVFRKYGHGMEEDGMLLDCWWNGKKCTSKDFFPSVEGMGLCHSFNSGRLSTLKHTTDPGETNGLRLTLNIQSYDYTDGAPAIGLKLRVHDQHDLPLVTDLGFAVMPGRKAYVTVTKKEVINLPKPYGADCLDKHSDYVHDGLTIGECWRYCMHDLITKKCKCRMDSHLNQTENEIPLCDWENYTKCYHTIARSLHVLLAQNCSCPKLCTKTSFETDISYALFNGVRESPALLSAFYNTTGQRTTRWSKESKEIFLRQNVLELSIFYQELSFDRNEDIAAYTFESFIAEAGGTMGLFLGASVLTVVEVIDLLCYILTILIFKKS